MRIWIGFIAFGLVLCGQIREEQKVLVDGVMEVWQLRWKSPPKPFCEATEESAEASLTCPCAGFAYGEAGELVLVRLRNEAEIDRLELTGLFHIGLEGAKNLAVLKIRAADFDRDLEASNKPGFVDAVAKRPLTQIMHLADYDHDGQKTEFYLQTGTEPCAKSYGLVIGVSKLRRKLHAFGRAVDPMRLKKEVWEALRDSSGRVKVVERRCGDHGANTETVVELGWTQAGVEGVSREYSCEVEPRVMLSEQPL
jgi:hypothetical protein